MPIRNFLLLPGLLSVLIFAGTNVNAAIYSRKDSSGHVYITDNAAAAANYRIILTTAKRPQGFQEMVVTGVKFAALIQRAARETGLDPAFIQAVIRVESNFNPRALSKKGAQGLMQLLPALARQYGVKDAFDPAANVLAGSRYLKKLQDRFGSLEKTLAAYNAGPSRVLEYGGPPPFAETKKYIVQVKWYYKHYRERPDLVKLEGAAPAFTEARLAFVNGDLRRAAFLFTQVLTRYPASPEARYNLALVKDRQGRLTEAIQLYRQALHYNPCFSEAGYNLAILYERIKRPDLAVCAWQRCRKNEISPEKRKQIKLFIQELQRLRKQERR